MRINLLSSFAAGMLIATSISGAVYFSSKSNVSNVSKAVTKTTVSQPKQPTEAEMKTKLESKGYVVKTKADYDKSINDAKTAAAQKSTQPGNNPAPAPAPQTVTKVVVNVADGMTSWDVGHVLQQAGLIQMDAFSFSKDIEKRGIENKLRPGSYSVDSSMSYEQIVSTIFK